MKLTLVALTVLAIAAPTTFVATSADAQVLTGRGAPRSSSASRPARPRLSAAEQDRLWEGQDQITEWTQRVTDIEAEAQAAGGATAQQQGELQALRERITATQQEVDALKAKRDRRG